MTRPSRGSRDQLWRSCRADVRSAAATRSSATDAGASRLTTSKHDWIWVRRGRCPPCKKTFTVLAGLVAAVWSLQLRVPPDRRGMRSRKASPRLTAGTRRDCPMIPRSGAGLGASSSACCVGLVMSALARPSKLFQRPYHPCLGFSRRPAVFCAWRQTHHECPRRRRVTQAADSVVGLPGQSRLAARQAHRSRASDGTVSVAR